MVANIAVQQCQEVTSNNCHVKQGLVAILETFEVTTHNNNASLVQNCSVESRTFNGVTSPLR